LPPAHIRKEGERGREDKLNKKRGLTSSNQVNNPQRGIKKPETTILSFTHNEKKKKGSLKRFPGFPNLTSFLCVGEREEKEKRSACRNGGEKKGEGEFCQ